MMKIPPRTNVSDTFIRSKPHSHGSQCEYPTAPLADGQVSEIKSKLLQAQRDGKLKDVLALNRQLRNSMPLSYVVRRDRKAKEAQLKSQVHHETLKTGVARRVYVSVAQLQKRFGALGSQKHFLKELETALFIFNTSRDHVLKPKVQSILARYQREDRERKLKERVVHVSLELQQIILDKEERGHVFWINPGYDDMLKLSEWMSTVIDPMTGTFYRALQLRSSYWKHDFATSKAKYTQAGMKIVHTIHSGSGDWNALQELLLISNPTLEIVDASGRWNWTTRQRMKLLAKKGLYYEKGNV